MSKRSKILNLFKGLEWLDFHDPKYPKIKTVTCEDIESIGLSSRVEPTEYYSDVHYVRRVLKSLGYRVIITSLGVSAFQTSNNLTTSPTQ